MAQHNTRSLAAAMVLSTTLLLPGCATPVTQEPAEASPTISPTRTPLPSETPTPTALSWVNYLPTRTPPPPIPLAPIGVTNGADIQLLFTQDVPWDNHSYGLAHVSPLNDLVALAPRYGPVTLLSLPWAGDGILLPQVKPSAIDSLSVSALSLAFTPDGTLLAVASSDDTVDITDLSRRQPRVTLRIDDWTTSAAFTDDGAKIAVGTLRGFGGSLQLWDVASGTLEEQLIRDPPGGGICSLALSPSGALLVAGYCTYAYSIATWSVDDHYRQMPNITGLDEVQYCPHFCPEERNLLVFAPGAVMVASGTTMPTIPMFDALTGRLQLVITTARRGAEGEMYVPHPINGLAFSGDGSLLAIAAGNELQLRNTQDGAFLWHKENPWDVVWSAVAFTPDSRLMISVDSTGKVHFWGVPED